MKTILLMTLGALLLTLPNTNSVLHKKKYAKMGKKIEDQKTCTRVPLEYSIDISGNEDYLLLVIAFPYDNANIIVKDNKNYVVFEEMLQKSEYEKSITIYNTDAYPYTLEMTSSIVDITGEITLEEEY